MTAQLLDLARPVRADWHDAPSTLHDKGRRPEPAAPARQFGHGAVSAWMRPLAGACTESTPLRDAVDLMVASDVDNLVVVDEGGLLIGLIGYRSLIELVARGTYAGPTTVGTLLDRRPLTISPDTLFSAALRLLDPPDVTCVVVVERGRPLGVISEAHLARPTLDLVAASL